MGSLVTACSFTLPQLLTCPFPSHFAQWGNLRYAANVAFTMLLRAQTLPPNSRVSPLLAQRWQLLVVIRRLRFSLHITTGAVCSTSTFPSCHCTLSASLTSARRTA